MSPDRFDVPREVIGIIPGELLIFHGMVGGARGTCLVMSTVPLTKRWGVRFYLLAKDNKFIKYDTDWREEGVVWDRISDRC